MPSSHLTSKGQTTIPKTIREYLNLQPGDKIDFVVDSGGAVTLQPASVDVSQLEGILHNPTIKPVTIEEMKQTVKKRFRR